MKLHLVPVALAIVLLLAVFVSYFIAVGLNHVPAFLPYISDAGVLVPERSVFSQLINMAVVLQAAAVYIRFEQVAAGKHYKVDSVLVRLNRLGLCLGGGTALGLSLIGNFQLEGSFSSAGSMNATFLHEMHHINNVEKVHWFGAFLTFVGGVVWMFVQSGVSIRTAYSLSSRRRGVIRMILSLLSCVSLLGGIILALAAALRPTTASEGLEWRDGDFSPGHWRWTLSISAVCCEWILTLLIIAFTLTFIPEFRSLEFRSPEVILHPHKDGTIRFQGQLSVQTTMTCLDEAVTCLDENEARFINS